MGPLETFVGTTDRSIPELHQPDYSYAAPALYILTLLPSHARLNLRLVSHTIKTWADTEPSPLRYLHLTFPLSHYILSDVAIFQKLSRECWHLTVSLLPSTTALPESLSPQVERRLTMLDITSLTSLTHLHIVAPMMDDFYPLLAFRMALQRAKVPNLSHVTVSPLTLPGLMAMRWGPFTSYGETDWTGARVWRSLTRLEVGLVPWWRGSANDNNKIAISERERRRTKTERWKMGVMVLHDWLASFAAAEKLVMLKLWWYEEKGPNPLLLDKLAGEKGHSQWLSAPHLEWKGLRSLWLSQCSVTQEDVETLRSRCKDLEELWVENAYLDREVAGETINVDEVQWAKVWLGFQLEIGANIGSDEMGDTESEGVYAEMVDFEDYDEDGDFLDRSLEVPFGLNA